MRELRGRPRAAPRLHGEPHAGLRRVRSCPVVPSVVLAERPASGEGDAALRAAPFLRARPP